MDMNVLQHFKEGLRYKFPLCCILFFCLYWLYNFQRYYDDTGKTRGYLTRIEESPTRYVQCPLCLYREEETKRLLKQIAKRKT